MACYSNLTTLTTGNFGEWKTEQQGVGTACNNASVNYFLEIKINNETQGERRRLSSWDFLRKDSDDIITKDLKIKGTISGNKTVNTFGGLIVETKSDVAQLETQIKIRNPNNSTLSGSNIKIENDLGKSITLGIGSSNNKLSDPRGSSGGLGYSGGSSFGFTNVGNADWSWRVVNIDNFPNITATYVMKLNPIGNITFSLITDEGRFVIPKASPDFATWNSRSMMIGGDLRPQSINGGKDVNETRISCSKQGFTKIDCDTDLTGADLGVQDDLEVKDTIYAKEINATGNIITSQNVTGSSGFFSFLGSLTARITKLFIQDIDASNDAVIGRNLEVAENTTLKNDLLVKNNVVIQGDLEAGKGKLKLSTADDRVTITDVLRLKPRPQAPDNASLGDIYVDTTSKELCFFDGQNWIGVAKNGTCS